MLMTVKHNPNCIFKALGMRIEMFWSPKERSSLKIGSLSHSLSFSLPFCRKTSNKHTCSPDQSPQHCPNFPSPSPCVRALPFLITHQRAHTHTKHVNAHTHTHPPFLHTRTQSHSSLHTAENRAVRDRGERAGAVLWCNGRKCWCFIWNWWSLVSAALPGAGPLCAGCVNERSSRDWTGGAERASR